MVFHENDLSQIVSQHFHWKIIKGVFNRCKEAFLAKSLSWMKIDCQDISAKQFSMLDLLSKHLNLPTSPHSQLKNKFFCHNYDATIDPSTLESVMLSFSKLDVFNFSKLWLAIVDKVPIFTVCWYQHACPYYNRFTKKSNDLKFTALGREPVSVVYYTRPRSSIKRPTQN